MDSAKAMTVDGIFCAHYVAIFNFAWIPQNHGIGLVRGRAIIDIAAVGN